MIPTNLIHNTKNNPTIYKVYFLENVKKEIERMKVYDYLLKNWHGF
jgi:hypothetical protein